MRIQMMTALVALGALAAGNASAQEINLSGPYQCVVRLRRTCARCGYAERLGSQSRERSWHTFSGLGRLARSHWTQGWNEGASFHGWNDHPI